MYFSVHNLCWYFVCLSLCLSVNKSVRSVCHTDVHIYIYISTYIYIVCMRVYENKRDGEGRKIRKKKENYHLYTSPHRPSSTPFTDIIISPAFLRDTKHILYSFWPVFASVSVPSHTHTSSPVGGRKPRPIAFYTRPAPGGAYTRLCGCMRVWVCECDRIRREENRCPTFRGGRGTTRPVLCSHRRRRHTILHLLQRAYSSTYVMTLARPKLRGGTRTRSRRDLCV